MTAQFTICNKSWHYHWISYHIKSTLLPLLCQPFSKQTWFSWFPLDCIPALVRELNRWQGPFTGQTSFLLANQQCYSIDRISNYWSQPGIITHWSPHFFIHHRTPDGRGVAPFTLALHRIKLFIYSIYSIVHSLLCHCFCIRKSIRPAKNWVMRCWHSYLSGAKCKWFPHGPADTTATASSLGSLKSRLV